MATLFDPLSVALETVKTIEGVGSHKPDPPRFKVMVPINPGEWAKKEAFQRKHDLMKWSAFHSKIVARTDLKLPRIVSTGSTASSVVSEEHPVDSVLAEVTNTSVEKRTSSESSEEHEKGEQDDIDAPSFEEEEDEETQKIAKMTTNQKRYYKVCGMFMVTVNRKVLRCIDHFELVLSMMKMSNPEFKAIMAALVTNDNVERLDLTELRLTDQQVVYMTDFFSEENAVTDLILADNNLRGRSLQSFFTILYTKDNLAYLDISGNDLRDKDATMLADYIKSSETLMYLYMSRNNFTEKSGDFFGKMIGENSSLLDLDISSNRLRCIGAEKFFKGFSKNTNVHRLDFSWNGLGNEGVKAAVNMLKKNTTLMYLSLAGSRITGTDLELFYVPLKKNTTLQRLVLANNSFLMSDITSFLRELYKWTASGLQRVDFGIFVLKKLNILPKKAYQTVEKAAVPLIDLLFWEKNIDIRFGGAITYSKDSYKSEEVIMKFRDDPMALVTRLRADERMKLVKYFGQIDLQTAIDEGEVEITSESFLYKVRNNQVTYRDLANRVRRAGNRPYDVIRNVLEMAEIVESTGRPVPRHSLAPAIARRIYIKSRADEKVD